MPILIFLLLFTPSIFAQSYQGTNQDALFEAGAGAVYGSVPHYPGAEQNNNLLVPFPAVIYRGERYRLDEDGGARTRFFYSDSMEINLSVGGSLPVSSKDNRARAGMPKLDTMVEIGPGAIFHFLHKKNSTDFRLSLNIPIRQIISSDLKFTKARGQSFNPILYAFYDLNKAFTLFTSISGYWATKEYNEYIYSVEEKFVTPTRSGYKAHSGHVSNNYSAALIYTREDLSIFSGAILNDMKNNSNKSSPLFKRETSLSYAVGFTYFFYKVY